MSANPFIRFALHVGAGFELETFWVQNYFDIQNSRTVDDTIFRLESVRRIFQNNFVSPILHT